MAFVAFSPVARGALARGVKDPSTLPDKDLRRTHPRFDETNWPANLALVEQFNALADGAGITPAQLALSWVLSRGDHVHVIPGTASIPHLEENFETLALNVSQDVLDKADRLINQSTVSGHRYPERLQRTIDTEDFV